MPVATSSNSMARALCELWGLDPKLVRRLVIDLSPFNVATVRVELLLRNVDGFETTIRRYRLVEVADAR